MKKILEFKQNVLSYLPVACKGRMFLHFNAIFISYLPPDLRFPFQKLFIISVTFWSDWKAEVCLQLWCCQVSTRAPPSPIPSLYSTHQCCKASNPTVPWVSPHNSNTFLSYWSISDTPLPIHMLCKMEKNPRGCSLTEHTVNKDFQVTQLQDLSIYCIFSHVVDSFISSCLTGIESLEQTLPFLS